MPIRSVRLSCSTLSNGFLGSLPLRRSRHVIYSASRRFQVALHLHVAGSFIVRLLSQDHSLAIIHPLRLHREMCGICRRTLGEGDL